MTENREQNDLYAVFRRGNRQWVEVVAYLRASAQALSRVPMKHAAKTLFGTMVMAVSLIGCVGDEGLGTEEESETEEVSETVSELSTSTYTPFTGTSAVGSAATYVWKGYNTTYPSADENFRGYSLPVTVECSSSKSTRSHLDVTAGCLTAVSVGGYSRGKITSTSDGAFRAVALAFTGTQTSPLKWTDMHNQYRFYYAGSSGAGVDPGFKAFARYRTENDLYVASWRLDGVVQIKKKQNGSYSTLAQTTKSRPSTNTWHTIRFDAVGTRLDLYLDGTRVLTAYDSTFSWGTAGIRTDATNGAYLDEWTVK
jgi:hypothetical protein